MAEACTYNETCYYMDFYLYFMEKTTYNRVLKEDINNDILPSVQHLLQQDEISILSIGPGNGTPDLLLLQALDSLALSQQRSIHIFYTLVEPSDGFMTLLKSNMANLSRELKNLELSLDFKHSKAEDFFPTSRSSFDVVLLFHCLYYMDVHSVLSSCYHMLSEGGSMVIEIESAHPHKAAAFFQTLAEHLEVQVPKLTLRDLILAFLEEKGWKFSTSIRNYETDFTDCFKDDSVNGARLLEFYTHIPNIKERLGKDGWNSQLLLLKEWLVQDSESRWWGTLSDELMVVQKK